MKIIIESTPEFVTIDEGLKQARIWTGKTEHGASVVALIGRVGIDDSDAPALARAEAELGPAAPTTVVVEPATIVAALTSPADGVTPEESAAKGALDLLAAVSEAMIVCDGLIAQKSDPFHCAIDAIRKIFAGAPPPPRPPAPPPPSWLVKDFWILYQSAKALADACHGRGDARPHPPLMALDAQLARLAPAFEVCEAERRGGSPERLLEPERAALAALHRWLHSPSGDHELISAAQPYHDQIERDEPLSCGRLEAEEKAAREGDLGERARELVARVNEVIVERPGVIQGPNAPPAPHGAPGCTSPDPVPSTELSTAILQRLIDDPRSAAPDVDDASNFLVQALRGAQMGWHARLAHARDEWPKIRELAAPTGERDGPLSAWLFGFEVATTTPEPEPEPPIVLTPALRAYVREHLRYRAPEQKSPRDEAILAALDAEEAAIAEAPEKWIGAKGEPS